MSDWSDQVAVITGAASGIGAGLARHALNQGMQVIAADVDADGLRELSAQAGRLRTESLDVRDEDAVQRFADSIFVEHAAVNLLFNNAGVLVDGKTWERSIRDWRWILDVNVMGVVNGLRSFVPHMLAQNQAGRIVNTASIGGLLGGSAYMGLYQGTKHMIVALTESLFQELAAEEAPITASVLCPAEVATAIMESDRLRSEEQHNVLTSEAEQQTHAALQQGIASAVSVDDFAELVFDGIEANKFWLLPQPDFKPLFEARSNSVLNETDPQSMMELLALR